MPQGNKRSKSFRKRTLRTPGGRLVVHYTKRKHKKLVCAKCGRPLLGVPRSDSLSKNKIKKSERNPKRPYGGVLCSVCSREQIKLEKGVENV